MTPRFLSFILAALMLAACSTPAPIKPANLPRDDYAYAQRYLAWLIEKEMADNNVTGLSIAIVDDQRMVWSAGFGYADAEKEVKATPQTPYRMGSIAKLFTATAAMQMAERGQMDIDQPLSRYLPEFSVKSRLAGTGPITPRNIMTHHSGLPANYLNGMLDKNPKYFTTLVKDIKNEYVAYPPNYVWAYSNLGVTLLGAAIEQTSGQGYAGYIEHSLFQPLGMRDSYFSSQPGLKGYSNGKVSDYLPLRDLPSGGLVSNVEDLSHFMEMIFAGGRAGGQQILKPETLAEMFRPQNLQVPLDIGMRMGLGWMLSGSEIQGGGIVAEHGGSLLNFHSVLRILPEHKLGVIVAANSASAHSVVTKIAAEALRVMLDAKTGKSQPEIYDVAPASVTTAAIDAGYFDTVVGMLKVDSKSGNLNTELMDYSFRLAPQSNGWFGVKFNLLGLFPVSVSPLDSIHLAMTRINGRDVLIGNMGSETTLVGEKLQPSSARDALIDYVGKYEIVNGGLGVSPTSISMQYQDGMFIGECTFAQMPGIVLRVGLYPISKDEAVISGLGSGRGETMRMVQDQSEKHIFFSGLELRKIN